MRKENNEIALSNVCLAYGDNVIYDGFNATFGSGINVILGKSGCGKTSLLNIIAGLVRFSGDCNCSKPSIVFSEPTLAPVTVENNIKTVLCKRCDKQVENALRLARIYDKRKQNSLTLSDGEKQRVALARAFAVERQLMLLDEPFSRLDYGVKTQLYDTLINYLKSTSTTALLVTHDVDEALILADNVYFLDGKPCQMQLVASLTQPQSNRDIYDKEHDAVRKRLQALFTSNT